MCKRFVDHGYLTYPEFFKLLEDQRDWERRNGRSGTGEGTLKLYRFGNHGAKLIEDYVIER